ncbi:hypothetical protein Rfer_4401 (plasmid) [Rhodoferax ferrireducens T118]|uniref:Uncharacterized protein n=1 Tax=Albidiferax ferrireducens (strain ATCC BAA-621 / DSM 15236 / T118) TaxID=338969 RepID=Q21Q58_ALBFT|nr:hypothetical protein [Rhodoferax ferrireducens]ABD72087.1 hypothetical protein Rfer_4401 [Rhodoferax ferrireducens T118]
MINRAVLALALMAALPAMADVPNPLMAPTPRGTKTGAQSLTPMPPGGPSPMPVDQPSTTFGKKQVAPVEEAVDLQSTWYVSAIVGNSAMMRQRPGATSPKGSAGAGQYAGAGQFPGVYSGGGAPQQVQSGPAEVKTAPGMSLMVTDGEDTFVMGMAVRAKFRGDTVMLFEGSNRVPLFYGGVEASPTLRAERKVTELPDTAFASRAAPDTATGSSTGAAPSSDPMQPHAPQFAR